MKDRTTYRPGPLTLDKPICPRCRRRAGIVATVKPRRYECTTCGHKWGSKS